MTAPTLMVQGTATPPAGRRDRLIAALRQELAR